MADVWCVRGSDMQVCLYLRLQRVAVMSSNLSVPLAAPLARCYLAPRFLSPSSLPQTRPRDPRCNDTNCTIACFEHCSTSLRVPCRCHIATLVPRSHFDLHHAHSRAAFFRLHAAPRTKISDMRAAEREHGRERSDPIDLLPKICCSPDLELRC